MPRERKPYRAPVATVPAAKPRVPTKQSVERLVPYAMNAYVQYQPTHQEQHVHVTVIVQPVDDVRVFSMEEAAKRLVGMDESTLYDLVRDGKIAQCRLTRGRVGISMRELERYIESTKVVREVKA